MRVNSVRVNNEQKSGVSVTAELEAEFMQYWLRYPTNPMQGRNDILAAFCPLVSLLASFIS